MEILSQRDKFLACQVILLAALPAYHSGIDLGRFKMINISDEDYRSHALPCYPDDTRDVQALVRDMESRVELAITDFDYRTSDTPTFLVELRVAA